MSSYLNLGSSFPKASKSLEYSLALLLVLCIYATAVTYIISTLVKDPRLSIISFIFHDVDSGKFTESPYWRLFLNLYTLLYFTQSGAIILSYASYLIMICHIVPIILRSLNMHTRSQSADGDCTDFHKVNSKPLFTAYRQLQLLVYRICYAFDFILPLFTSALMASAILFNFAAFKLGALTEVILANLGEHQEGFVLAAGVDAAVVTVAINFVMHSVLLSMCLGHVLLLQLTVGKLAQFRKLSEGVLRSLVPINSKQINRVIKSCNKIQIPIGIFGHVG